MTQLKNQRAQLWFVGSRLSTKIFAITSIATSLPNCSSGVPLSVPPWTLESFPPFPAGSFTITWVFPPQRNHLAKIWSQLGQEWITSFVLSMRYGTKQRCAVNNSRKPHMLEKLAMHTLMILLGSRSGLVSYFRVATSATDRTRNDGGLHLEGP